MLSDLAGWLGYVGSTRAATHAVKDVSRSVARQDSKLHLRHDQTLIEFQCDNARPLCRICLDSGRECLGYTRETVFIVGTPKEKGRCSLLTRTPNKRKKSTTNCSSTALEITATSPYGPAFEELVPISTGLIQYHVRSLVLRTNLDEMVRIPSAEPDDETYRLRVPKYEIEDVQPGVPDKEFDLQGYCLVHLPPQDLTRGVEKIPEGISLFLFDVSKIYARPCSK